MAQLSKTGRGITLNQPANAVIQLVSMLNESTG
jgi:hypothetical protein